MKEDSTLPIFTKPVNQTAECGLKIKFSMKDSQMCQVTLQCAKEEHRTITVRTKELNQALQEVSRHQKSSGVWKKYRSRA